jgi:hypothetical protein
MAAHLEAPHNVHYSIALSDIRQELVAEPLALSHIAYNSSANCQTITNKHSTNTHIQCNRPYCTHEVRDLSTSGTLPEANCCMQRTLNAAGISYCKKVSYTLEAPFTRPAMSTNSSDVGITF